MLRNSTKAFSPFMCFPRKFFFYFWNRKNSESFSATSVSFEFQKLAISSWNLQNFLQSLTTIVNTPAKPNVFLKRRKCLKINEAANFYQPSKQIFRTVFRRLDFSLYFISRGQSWVLENSRTSSGKSCPRQKHPMEDPS